MAKLAVLEFSKGGGQEGIVTTVWKRNGPIILGGKTFDIFLRCVINLRVIVLELLGTYLDTRSSVKILYYVLQKNSHVGSTSRDVGCC